jgi:hypothetical protein
MLLVWGRVFDPAAERGSALSLSCAIVRLAALIWSAPSSRALPGLTGSETRSHKKKN